MANKFPLVIDTATSRIVELPVTDNLDLTGSNISNVAAINSTANVTASYFLGNGSQLTGISATVAQTVSNAAQPNITSTGTLVSLNVSGDANLTGTVTNISNANITTANVTNLILDKYNETVVSAGNTGAATLTPDASAGTIYRYTLTGNITLSALANAVAGTSMTIILTQDATGNRTLTSTMKFAGASKTLSTAANSIDIMSVFYDGTTYYATLSKGYA